LKKIYHVIFEDKEKCLNVKIPKNTKIELLLTNEKGETRLDFDCVRQFFLGKPQDTIGDFNTK